MQDSVIIVILTYNEEGQVETQPVSEMVYSKGERRFFVPDTSQDCAAMILEISDIKIPIGHKMYSLPRSSFVTLDSLFAGLPVVIPCYPHGIITSDTMPLLRRGHIAGVDLEKNLIYIDAQVFGGSSGGPVYIDAYDEIGRRFMDKNGDFVGQVFAAKVAPKVFVNRSDPQEVMIIKENSGLGIAIPAHVIAGFIDFLAESWEKKSSRK